ncbi:DNA topoisomerase IV [Belliella kenyensis]|uniref:DNA topoisomerase IV n=1 Tax=Belliella kenyensis TaxID=1472724 RepID=A0ABV8EJZ9_9BACT|nr:DNA topoisomerase IV [Belliella kenyensis]MCH7403189.1 DNA topoisomerase IV [Belliella kenyensis]MDN3604800.1 DNA topoisomerase IV [Belliella kenyensis]
MMYYRFGKVFHFATVLLFVLVFLYIYAALADIVAYQLDEGGGFDKVLTKEAFFYGGVITFILLNIILVVPAKVIENQSVASLRRIFPKGELLTDYILAWMYSFVGVVNIAMIIMAFFVHSINNQHEISAGDFSFFFYLVPILFTVWIVALFWILIKKFNSVKLGQ